MAIDSALLSTMLAARALTQLNRRSIFPKMGIVNYEEGNFERNEDVKIRRAKKRTAQNVDTRGAGLTLNEGEYINGTVVLERLWGDGFPIFSDDPGWSIERYIEETSIQVADAIVTSNDDYMYGKYRDFTDIPATGLVNLSVHPPIAIVSAEDGSGGYADYNNDLLRFAQGSMKREQVLFGMGEVYAALSTTAETAFIGDALVVSGETPAAFPGPSGGVSILRSGIPRGTFIDRWGFKVTGSNGVGGQTAVADVDDAGPAAFSAAADDTTMFFDGEAATPTPVGAVNFTFTSATIDPGVAVGQIARIAPAGGGAVAHGIILRIDTAGANPIISLVPFSPKGIKLPAAAFTAGTDLISIPEIGSVNVANHKEGLLCATRNTRVPSPGTGVAHSAVADAETGMSIQIYMGNFQVKTLQEERGFYSLTGAKFSDYRKGCLMLSL